MSERGRVYDEEIAPVLLDLMRKCAEAGLNLIAVCEWAPNEYGESSALKGPRSASMMLVRAAVKARGNVDALMLAVERHAREHGHGSIYLMQRGIPIVPAPTETEEKDDEHPR